jgi:hypothetical protein
MEENKIISTLKVYSGLLLATIYSFSLIAGLDLTIKGLFPNLFETMGVAISLIAVIIVELTFIFYLNCKDDISRINYLFHSIKASINKFIARECLILLSLFVVTKLLISVTYDRSISHFFPESFGFELYFYGMALPAYVIYLIIRFIIWKIKELKINNAMTMIIKKIIAREGLILLSIFLVTKLLVHIWYSNLPNTTNCLPEISCFKSYLYYLVLPTYVIYLIIRWVVRRRKAFSVLKDKFIVRECLILLNLFIVTKLFVNIWYSNLLTVPYDSESYKFELIFYRLELPAYAIYLTIRFIIWIVRRQKRLGR